MEAHIMEVIVKKWGNSAAVRIPSSVMAAAAVWLEFSPQAGHEQAGHRPALVLSPSAYNSKTGTMVCCPMTTQIKGYPFEVIIHAKGISGAVLSDQDKNLDLRLR